MNDLQKRILLVEGDDDKHFVKNFCCRSEILSKRLICKFTDDNEEDNDDDCGGSQQILYIDSRSRQKGGINEMIEDISLKIKDTGREVVGILADANGYDLDSDEHPWRRIKNKLEETLNLEEILPEQPCRYGLILPNITPKKKPKSTLRVGVWMMPDNESPGELENFFAKLIPAANPSWALAKEYISRYMNLAGQHQQGSFDTQSPYKLSKAEVYAWLATRKKPGKMGAAISKGHGLDFDTELARRFARWLENLFCS